MNEKMEAEEGSGKRGEGKKKRKPGEEESLHLLRYGAKLIPQEERRIAAPPHPNLVILSQS